MRVCDIDIGRRRIDVRRAFSMWAATSSWAPLDLYGHLYPGDMDRYADRLDSAADDAGKAKIRPDDEDDDPAAEESAL